MDALSEMRRERQDGGRTDARCWMTREREEHGGCTRHWADAFGYWNSDKAKSIRRRDSRRDDELSSYLSAVGIGELIIRVGKN